MLGTLGQDVNPAVGCKPARYPKIHNRYKSTENISAVLVPLFALTGEKLALRPTTKFFSSDQSLVREMALTKGISTMKQTGKSFAVAWLALAFTATGALAGDEKLSFDLK